MTTDLSKFAATESETFSPAKSLGDVEESQLIEDELGIEKSKSVNYSASAVDFANQAEIKRHQTLNKVLPLQWVEQNLHHRIASDGFYSDFLVYIPFLALFIVFFLNGRDIEVNHMAAASNRKLYMAKYYPDIANTAAAIDAQGATDSPVLKRDRVFEEIEGADDFHAWFSSVLISGTWDCEEPDYSRSTLVKRGQMQYIGALKIRVLVASNDSCGVNSQYGDDTVFWNNTNGSTVSGLPTECFAQFDSDEIQTHDRCDRANPTLVEERLWKYHSSSQDTNGFTTTGQMTIYPAGGYIATIPFNATCTQVIALHDLIKSSLACNIINDRETRFVMLEWFQYAANTDTFMMNKYFLEITAGGGWIPNFQVRMFPVWTAKRLGMSIFDIIFFIFVLYFVVRLISDWISYYRTHKKVIAFLFDLWNVLEFVNIVTLVTVCILRWVWWTKSRSSKINFPFNYGEYPRDLDDLVLTFSVMIYANSFNVVITILKVLKYFQLNNRLNILTRTLSVSQQGIVGVLALFLFILCGYAICGTLLYGGYIFGFKNVNTSFSSLSFLLLGQFDYPAMRALQPELTGFFFFSFVVLCNFLLLNFIIAILSDGFATVSKDTALEPLDESILNQIYLIQEYFSIRNLKKMLELRRSGKTRLDLLRDVHKYLGEHIDLIARHTPSLLDNDIPMHRTDLRHWLPEQLYSDLGDNYVDLLWEDMVRDFNVDSASATFQLHHDIEESVQKGVALIVKKQATLDPLADLDVSMQRVDDMIDRIVVVDVSQVGSNAFASRGTFRRRANNHASVEFRTSVAHQDDA